MPSYSAANERIKRQYFAYLAEAQGHSEQTIDAVAKAVARFQACSAHSEKQPAGSVHPGQRVVVERFRFGARFPTTATTAYLGCGEGALGRYVAPSWKREHRPGVGPTRPAASVVGGWYRPTLWKQA